MSLIKETEIYLKEVVNKIGYEIDEVKLETSSVPELGQFQINLAMSLAKQNKTNPREIANKIVESLDDRFTNVNIAGPGFINLTFNDKVIANHLNQAINNFDMFVDLEEPKTIIIDYGGANAAKALHVGHMRSANIGEALKRLAKLYKNNVIGDVHLGDLGRQAGMIISQLMVEQPDLEFFDENFKGEYPKINLTNDDLARIYPLSSTLAKEDPERMELVRDITAKIDEGHHAYGELWKQIVAISSKNIKEVYNKLNCHFELWEGEMDAFEYIPKVIEIMDPYLYESEGALVMDIKEDTDTKELPPLMVIKKDGATKYETRELGTLYSRIQRFNPDEIWYVVDQRQALHFEQVFRGSYKSGLVPKTTKLYHYGFGTINGNDGKPFKTRDGGVMELDTLIEMIKSEIEKKIKPEIISEEREKIANSLTIATLKYTDLLPFRKTDYIFDPVKFSSLEGKTGPYILYTIVRIKSLLNKIQEYNSNKIEEITNNDVRNILVKLIELPKSLKRAYEEATLNYLTEYIYDLCSLYNKFYSNNNILNEPNEQTKNSYIALSNLVHNTCEKILDVLAIETIDKM
ncbi:MAG: arginine--tRNA ligase [Bacilli bacterium]|nr:arginine--tRNA ligase [Bacilli bacterium]MDD4733685.1 arginine--tRNA ligase [Bacilli bacterium]